MQTPPPRLQRGAGGRGLSGIYLMISCRMRRVRAALVMGRRIRSREAHWSRIFWAMTFVGTKMISPTPI